MTAPVKERGTRRSLPLHFRSAFPFAAAFPQRLSHRPKILRGEKISHEGGPAVSKGSAQTF